MDGIKPALAVGQIWMDKGLRPTIVLERAGQWEQLRRKVQNDNFWVEISDLNADGTIKNHSEYGTSDIDLVQFLGYAPGYGPSAIEHKAVSVEEPVEHSWLTAVGGLDIGIRSDAPTDAELHARDGLTATDRRLLNERMERQRKTISACDIQMNAATKSDEAAACGRTGMFAKVSHIASMKYLGQSEKWEAWVKLQHKRK